MTLLLIQCPATVGDVVNSILAGFGRGTAPKGELRGTEVLAVSLETFRKKRSLPAVSAVGAIVTLGSPAFEEAVAWARNADAQPGILAMVEEFNSADIDRIVGQGYGGLVGITRARVVDDPEEAGQFATLLKQAMRKHVGIAGQLKPKPLGWKLPTRDDDYARRSLLSLFLDARMRDFMQRLSFVCLAQREPPIGAPPLKYEELVTVFRTLGASLRQGAGKTSFGKEQASLKGYLSPATRTARPDAILLEGETGSGKTLCAKWIAAQLTPGREVVHVPLVNVKRDLLEAELFGTLAGGWTDAVSRPGQLHQSWGRVVLLDEIGDAPPEVQAKLLVYLDSFRLRPDGWPFTDDVYSPCYLVAATNRDLRAMVREGTFREDLYYRFRHRLRLPPLRERAGDLRMLVDFALQDARINPMLRGQRNQRAVTAIDIAALEKLDDYPFPGNYRELEDLLSRAVFKAVRAGRHVIRAEDIDVLLR